MNQLDKVRSTHWAVAGLAGAGAIVAVNWFDLVNLETGRAHNAMLISGGINGGLGGNSASAASYTEFKTSRPANFDDFDTAGACLSSVGAGFIITGSLWAFTVFDKDISTPANEGKLSSVFVADTGIGVQAQFSIAAHGVLKMIYGYGKPSGGVDVPYYLQSDDKIPHLKRSPGWAIIPKVK
ncbi:MAG: hypothetical protein ACRD43_00175 [Pyrinomonadaceae bacterium]